MLNWIKVSNPMKIYKISILGDKFNDLADCLYFESKEEAERATEKLNKITGHEIDFECETINVISNNDKVPDIFQLSAIIKKPDIIYKSKGDA